MSERRLDVSELEPCEPMEQTLAATAELRSGDYIRVLHRREPHLIYPMLENLGCRWHCRSGRSHGFEILIWRDADPAAAAAVAAALLRPPE